MNKEIDKLKGINYPPSPADLRKFADHKQGLANFGSFGTHKNPIASEGIGFMIIGSTFIIT